MPQQQLSVDEIFGEALAFASAAERSAYLQSACQGDAALRQRVEKLLAAYPLAKSFIETPAQVGETTVPRSIEAHVGTTIGPYKLLEQIGEGGMGLVFMAEQQRPVRRLVALKLIKPGMDSKQVIARFEAERQALALMDHPNIARILDAGTVGEKEDGESPQDEPEAPSSMAPAAGRPYFVMELVHGIPINEFCDEKRLPVRDRLVLFIQVCQAVQHAHQKGVIHRDLKPTNVLVTMADSVPVPKVIDFGIAKALGQSLTEHTLHTGFAQLVGTPLYMSPEQAEMNLFGVDTRSDVYSLGVMLYELLTGATPFDKAKLTKAGLDEMRRIIREEEPPRPSSRVSTLGAEALSTISHRRSTDPRRITTALRGELDWIVMRALEKDRARRYESASALAADLQHFLDDEPVLACPPSAGYRFRKFARRHKAALTTVLAVAASLLLGTGISLWQAVRATAAEGQAKANEATAKTEERRAHEAAIAERRAKESEAIQRQKAEKHFDAAFEAVERMLAGVGSPALNEIPRVQPVRRRMLEDAMKLYRRFTSESNEPPQLRWRLGEAWRSMAHLTTSLGDYEASREAHRESIAVLTRLVAESPENVAYRRSLADAKQSAAFFYCWAMPDYERSERLFLDAYDLYDRALGKEPAHSRLLHLAKVQQGLGSVYLEVGKLDEAIAANRRAIEFVDQSGMPAVAKALAFVQLAQIHGREQPDEADRDYEQAIAEFRRHQDQAQHDVRTQFAKALCLAGVHLMARHPEEAEAYLRESLSKFEQLHDDYPTNPHHRSGLAHATRHLAQLLLQQLNQPSAAVLPPRVKQSRLAEIRDLYADALHVADRLVLDFPESARYREELARIEGEQKSLPMQESVGEPAEVKPDSAGESSRFADAQARELLSQAIQLCDEQCKRDPGNVLYRDRLTELKKLHERLFSNPALHNQP